MTIPESCLSHVTCKDFYLSRMFFFESKKFFFTSGIDDDFCFFFYELFSDGFTEAAGGACDDVEFVFMMEIHRLLCR